MASIASITSLIGRSRPLAALTFFCYFSDNVSSDSTNSVFEFGPFRLEPGEHRLLCKGRSVPLTGKAFDTLRVLLERWTSLGPLTQAAAQPGAAPNAGPAKRFGNSGAGGGGCA